MMRWLGEFSVRNLLPTPFDHGAEVSADAQSSSPPVRSGHYVSGAALPRDVARRCRDVAVRDREGSCDVSRVPRLAVPRARARRSRVLLHGESLARDPRRSAWAALAGDVARQEHVYQVLQRDAAWWAKEWRAVGRAVFGRGDRFAAVTTPRRPTCSSIR